MRGLGGQNSLNFFIPDCLRVAKMYREHHQPGQPPPVRLAGLQGDTSKFKCNLREERSAVPGLLLVVNYSANDLLC